MLLNSAKYNNIIELTPTIKQMSYSYIPPDRYNVLVNFKYAGGTDSITYQYLWSPFANYLLKFVPEWVAPNLITLSGLSLLAVVNIIFMLPDQDDIIPTWKYILMAVSILIYQHLDNLDGKQARKTQSSSPLGMLFDHGSDAVTAFFLGVQVMKICKLTFGFQLFCVYVLIMNLYFCAMWSQYCVGYFKLGRINPVDEGLPMYALFCIVASQINFGQYHIIGTYGQEFIYSLFLICIPQTIYMVKDIMKNRIVPRQQIIFMPWLYVSSGIAILLVYLSIPVLDGPVFYLFFYSLMFMWSRNMINIQLQHITKQKYRVFNRGTLSFLVLCGFYALFNRLFNIEAYTYFLIMCLIQAIAFFEFTARVFYEGAKVLGIRVFSLKKPVTKTN